MPHKSWQNAGYNAKLIQQIYLYLSKRKKVNFQWRESSTHSKMAFWLTDFLNSDIKDYPWQTFTPIFRCDEHLMWQCHQNVTKMSPSLCLFEALKALEVRYFQRVTRMSHCCLKGPPRVSKGKLRVFRGCSNSSSVLKTFWGFSREFWGYFRGYFKGVSKAVERYFKMFQEGFKERSCYIYYCVRLKSCPFIYLHFIL